MNEETNKHTSPIINMHLVYKNYSKNSRQLICLEYSMPTNKVLRTMHREGRHSERNSTLFRFSQQATNWRFLLDKLSIFMMGCCYLILPQSRANSLRFPIEKPLNPTCEEHKLHHLHSSLY